MRSPLCVMLIFVMGAACTAPLRAETVLRWKLREGEKLAVEMTQETHSQVGFSAKSANTKINLAMSMTWQVLRSDESEIVLKQTIDSLRAEVTSEAGLVQFDSGNPSRATGMTKQLADSLRPLVGAEIEVTFSPRGEVKSAKPTNDAAQSLFASPDESEGAAGTSKGSLAQLVSQSIVPLPEKAVTAGDQWTVSREIQSAAGPLVQETVYTAAGVVEQEGERVCNVTIESRLPSGQGAGGQPSATSPLRIKGHEQTGSVSFSVDGGRPRVAQREQKLQTQRSYRDTTIDVTLSSRTKMTFASAKEGD